jgi:hypothetical protein
MATLVLQAAGAAVGGLLGPVGAILGRAVGGLAGALIDQSLFGGGKSSAPQIRDLTVTASTEGSPIPRVYGRAKVGGQVVWATELDAVVSTARSGGKGGVLGGATTESVSYYANFAVGLCEGPIAAVRRVWADGNPLDLDTVTMRVHPGDEAQEADPLIVAKEGADAAPAYRGLAYVVFEGLALAAFGNRIPQLAFEVLRPVGALERRVRAVTLIPGATEFGYDTAAVARRAGFGVSQTENRHLAVAPTDWTASLDELQALCPNLEHVSLVVAWFGDDLRCGRCTVAPRVEDNGKVTTRPWSAGGLGRAAARRASLVDGAPAYGGSPSDDSVVAAIRDLAARGLKVTLYPFLMMDVAADNALPDPRTGAASQPAYPWRGDITCDPAPGAPGTVDGSAAVADQVAAFFGTATAAHFSVGGGRAVYAGPNEWSWRRFVLHMAALGKAAGGVDALVIGSELPALTRVRSASGVYPAAAELRALAAEARKIVGPGTKLTYAADWTEYGAHVLDGGAEVRFPLDPLWASADIDAVGIDWYAPLADWRDGTGHADQAVTQSVYDPAYLGGNVAGGEAYDWYYADDAARDAQDRTPITDGLGKPWVFRQKDIAAWWANPHRERVGGVEVGGDTAWVPQGKPVWLTEAGCPAVDKGANAPNLFPDPKSSASGLPHDSTGARDDLMQRRAIEAVLAHWDPAAGANPVSAVYGAPILDPARIALWTWDARPWPAFPLATSVWSDGPAWQTGHWLNGRLGQAPLAELVAAAAADSGIGNVDAGALEGVIDGLVVSAPSALREVLQPLADLFAFAAHEREGAVVLAPRGRGPRMMLAPDTLALDGEDAPLLRQERAQETETAAELAVSFLDVAADFQPSVATARRSGTRATGQLGMDTAIVAWRGEMIRRAEQRLQDLWVARDTANFALPPNAVALEAGDLVGLAADGGARLFEVTEVTEGAVRAVAARAIAPEIFAPGGGTGSLAASPVAVQGVAAFPEVLLLDLPAAGSDPPTLLRVAAAASPWPRGIALWRDAGGSFVRDVVLTTPATAGETLDALLPGPAWRFDRAAAVTVRLGGGTLIGSGEAAMLAGANLAAIAAPDGPWEIIRFAEAELVGAGTWRISTLLRGLSGTEDAAAGPKPAGSRFVMLDQAVAPLVSGIGNVGRSLDWRAAPLGRDHADPFATAFSARVSDLALQPRRPVHPRAVRGDAGIALRWIGRSRGEDGWGVEPPLDLPEAWRIDVLDGAGAVRRSIEAPAARALYAAADEIADFGAPQTALTVQIAQVSPLVGAGPALKRTLHVG